MKKVLHFLGIHDWKYEIPISEKIKEPERFGSMLEGYAYTGKWVSGYAFFQKSTCQICGKNRIERVS